MVVPSYIGRYEVRHEIAQGGFAEVVLAWDEDLRANVAIKILHAHFIGGHDDIQQRFLDEARLLRRIRSASVVTIHDVGRLADGRPYFVMDFADRGTLAARFGQALPSTKFDTKSLSILVDAMADGLSGIHEAGVVHRDVKPANILFQAVRRAGPDPDLTVIGDASAEYCTLVGVDERVLLGDLGFAKDMLCGDVMTQSGGTMFYRAPEQAVGDAEITSAADVYSASAVLWEAITRQRPPHADAVVGSLANLPPSWHDVMKTGLAFEAESRFVSIDSWRGAVQDVLSQAAAETNTHVINQSTAAAIRCPYKGLASYQPEDAHSFYGREILIDELVRRIQLQNVLVVGGPSGSGKSSLVRAGLIPALRAGAIMGSETWPIVLLTPGRDPMSELYFQFARVLPNGRDSPVSLPDLIARPALARHLGQTDTPSQPIVVCIDQFEELFTLSPADQLAKMVEALSAMTDPAHSPIRLIIIVRADFYAACAQIPWLAECITENQVLVGPMTEPELRRAIAEPARRVGLYLERSLVDAVVSESGNEVGALPLVAHAMVETWIRRRGSTLTLEGFRAAGGVAGAISQTADLTFENVFDDAEKKESKRLFLRLVTPGEGKSDASRILALSEVDSDPGAAVIRRVIERLTAARLLTVSHSTVQIAHEALLRTWPRLRDWIEESRDNLRARQRISRAAEEWEGEGRDLDRLYHGAHLLSTLAWVEEHGDQLGSLENVFIDASRALADQQKAEAREKQQLGRRRRHIAIGALGIFATGATVASVVAFLAFQQAETNKQVAEVATKDADQRFGGALGAVAKELVEKDPLLALYLSAEAMQRGGEGGPGFDARSSLLAVRLVLSRGGPALLGSPLDMGDAKVFALSPDGALLAVGDRDGTVSMASTTSRLPIASRPRGHEGGVEEVDFGPRGDVLASVGDDGKVRLWSTDGGLSEHSTLIGSLPDVVWSVRFSPDGATLATAAENGTVALWDVRTSTALNAPLIQRIGDFLSLAFEPGGRGLIAGNGEGDIYGWSLPDRASLFEPIKGVHTSDIWKLTFDPQGRTFATSSSDGRSNLFAYPSGKLLGAALNTGDKVAGVAFTSDGSRLFGGGSNGELLVWDVRGQKLEHRTAQGHDGPIIDLVYSSARNLIVTLARDRLIRFWRAEAFVPLFVEHRLPGGPAKGLALASDGSLVAAAGDGGKIAVWSITGSIPTLLETGRPEQIWALEFSPDNKQLISADRGGMAEIWDVASGRLLFSVKVANGAIWSVLVDPLSGHYITTSEKALREWDGTTAAPVRDIWTSPSPINRAALSPDGRYIAVALTDAKVKIIERASGVVEKEITVDHDAIWSVAFSPNGKKIATASGNEVVSVWDIASGIRIAKFTGHSGGATDVAFMPDGVSLAAVDRQGKLHFLDVATGRHIVSPWPAHQGSSWRLVVKQDAGRFVTAGDDGLVKSWDVFDISRACAISWDAFDEPRRKQYFGNGRSMLDCPQSRS
jgi:WD40 repeat protein/serine/threonine protein kinase